MLNNQKQSHRLSALLLGSLVLPLSSCAREPENRGDQQLRLEFAEAIANTRISFKAQLQALEADLAEIKSREISALNDQIAELQMSLATAKAEQQRILSKAEGILTTAVNANLPPKFIDARYQLTKPLEFTVAARVRMVESVLKPTVRLGTSEKEYGSGTIIFCSPLATNSNERLVAILTARHVVRDITQDDVNSPHFPTSVYPGTATEIKLQCRELCRAEVGDASIVFAFTSNDLPVAKFASKAASDGAQVLDAVALSGCPEVLPPIVTFGHIALLSRDLPKERLNDDVLTTSDAFFGNSGGAAYLLKPGGEGRLLGVLTKVAWRRDAPKEIKQSSTTRAIEIQGIPHVSYLCGHDKIFAMLSAVGFSFGDDGQVIVSDANKLNEALNRAIK